MPLMWDITEAFTFDVKYTYILLSFAVLRNKSETDRFYDKVSVNTRLGLYWLYYYFCAL